MGDDYLAIVTTEAKGVHEHKFKKSEHKPKPDEIVAEVAYSGLNHIDVNQVKTGAYITAFPFVIGKEWSGKVVEVGSDVKDLKVGDAVSYVWAHIYLIFMCIASYQGDRSRLQSWVIAGANHRAQKPRLLEAGQSVL
jgi:NADPH:quinone reductase-like Zn-dependent oxidoreductase